MNRSSEEDADHRGFEDQHEERELTDALVDGLPRAQQRIRRQERRQHDSRRLMPSMPR